jgi:hypothetical protein
MFVPDGVKTFFYVHFLTGSFFLFSSYAMMLGGLAIPSGVCENQFDH